MATSTPEVEKNISFFLSPSAANIFIVCHVDISAKYPNDLHNSYKLKLWKASEKTKTCCFTKKEIWQKDIFCVGDLNDQVS